MEIALFALSAISGAAQSAFGKLHAQQKGDPYRFNFLKALFAFVLFFASALLTREGCHTQTVLYGATYGICLSLSMHFGYCAIAIGPLALSNIVSSFSLLLPFFYGILRFNEKINIYGAIGLLLIFASLICINLKEKREKQKLSALWWVYIFVVFSANGTFAMIQTGYQHAFGRQYQFTFLSVAMLVCVTVFGILCLIKKPKKSDTKTDLFAGLSGVTNGLYQFFTLWLIGLCPASMMFPILSAVTGLAVVGLGTVLFHEKISRRQAASVVLGITAIFLLRM